MSANYQTGPEGPNPMPPLDNLKAVALEIEKAAKQPEEYAMSAAYRKISAHAIRLVFHAGDVESAKSHEDALYTTLCNLEDDLTDVARQRLVSYMLQSLPAQIDRRTSDYRPGSLEFSAVNHAFPDEVFIQTLRIGDLTDDAKGYEQAGKTDERLQMEIGPADQLASNLEDQATSEKNGLKKKATDAIEALHKENEYMLVGDLMTVINEAGIVAAYDFIKSSGADAQLASCLRDIANGVLLEEALKCSTAEELVGLVSQCAVPLDITAAIYANWHNLIFKRALELCENGDTPAAIAYVARCVRDNDTKVTMRRALKSFKKNDPK